MIFEVLIFNLSIIPLFMEMYFYLIIFRKANKSLFLLRYISYRNTFA